MNEKLEKILKELGLTESEIRTYVEALKRGPSAVSDLAACTGLTRQSIYNATGKLVECGLMSTDSRYGDGGRSIYTAEEPRKLLECVDKKKREVEAMGSMLEGLMPELEMVAGGDKPVIRVLEGYDGLCAAMAEIVESGDAGGYEMVDFDRLQDVIMPEEVDKLHQIVKHNELRDITGVYSHGAPPHMLKMQKRSVTLPKDDSGFGAVISTFRDKIVLVSFRGKMHTVIIEDECLAKAIQVLFRHTYENASATEAVPQMETAAASQ